MKKQEIIDYLIHNLEYDVEYGTEAWFLDKAHKQLLSFSCIIVYTSKSEVLKYREMEIK